MQPGLDMRIVFFLLISSIISIEAMSQSSVQNADSLFNNANYKEAITHYKKTLHSKSIDNKLAGKSSWYIGKCYSKLLNPDTALYYFDKALGVYRTAMEWSSVELIHRDIFLVHSDVRRLNLHWTRPKIKSETVKEVYFKISKVIYDTKDSVTIEVNAGSFDGIILGTGAKCIGLVATSGDRTGWFLAGGKTIFVSENKARIKAKLVNTGDTLKKVKTGDLVSLFCKFNKELENSVFCEVGRNNIFFLNNKQEQFYEWRNLISMTDSVYEKDFYQILKWNVTKLYNAFKSDTTYEHMICNEGLFKGETLMSGLSKTNVLELRSFLYFIKINPGMYIQCNTIFAQYYANWILQNAPTSAAGMIDYYSLLNNKKLRADYIKNYEKEIRVEDYFNIWKTEILKNIKQNNFENIATKLEMLLDVAELFSNKNHLAWYHYSTAKYHHRLKDTIKANLNFRKALEIFTGEKNNEGVYLCREALKYKQIHANPEIVMQNAHTGPFDLCFSPDGKFFVTGSHDRTIKLWDARLGKEIISVKAHKENINSVTFSYDGRYIISCSEDKTVKLWDADNLQLIKTFETGMLNTKVILSKNADFFIVCGEDSIIHMWDIEHDSLVKNFSKHKERVSNLCWGINENEFYSCGVDSMIYRWQIKENITNLQIKEVRKVSYIQISPDGRWLLNTLENGKVRIWDIARLKTEYYLDIIKNYNRDSSRFVITEPVFSNDSRFVIYGREYNEFVIRELASGKGIRYTTSHYDDIRSIRISDDGSCLATIGQDLIMNLYDFKDYVFDLKYRLRHVDIEWDGDAGSTVIFNNNNNLITYGSTYRIYNLSTGKSDNLVNYLPVGNMNSIFDEEYKNMVFVYRDELTVVKFNLETKAIDTLYTSQNKIKNIDFNFSKNQLIVYDNSDHIYFIDKNNKSKFTGANLPDTDNRGLIFSKVHNKIYLAGIDFINIYDSALQLEHVITSQNDTMVEICISPSQKYLARTVMSGVQIIDLATNKTIHTIVIDSFNTRDIMYVAMNVGFSPNDSIVVLTLYNLEVQIWNWKQNRLIKKFKNHSTFILSLAISNDGKYFATSSLDSKIVLYNLKKGEVLCSLYPRHKKGILTITDSNYYMAPRNCYEAFVFKINKEIYTPEQFDLIYHRPDLVVKKIGMADAEIINTYKSAYLKRLERNGLTEANVSSNFHLPTIAIKGKENLPITTSLPSINLSTHSNDALYTIKSIRLWVNNIPIYGIKGLAVAPASEVNTELNITLQKGVNKIRIASVNDKGIESLKEYYQIFCSYTDTLVKPKLYLIVISVSKYKDKSYNLTYAAKDGRDIIATFKTKYSSMSIDSFIDERATKENILAVKSKLMKTNVNDKVIVFVSGHGVLDKKYDFYFATHDMNFNKPEVRGISYEKINDLLDGIPARQKLLLMDACHSGEIDKTAPSQNRNTPKDTIVAKSEVAQKGTKMLNLRKMKLQNTFDLMQELFSDMNNSNGAVAISAARGTGYALESASWNNGVFTYALINGLKNYTADIDQNGDIKLTEISSYLIEEVDRLTNGNQKPTSRAENLEYDWQIW